MKTRKKDKKSDFAELTQKNPLCCQVHKTGSSVNKVIAVNTKTTENS